MTLGEIKYHVMFQTNNDVDDIGDYEPHIKDYINEAYDRLVRVWAKVHTKFNAEDYPSLADVQDFKFNVQTGKHNWSLPSSAVKLDEVSSVLGGWKAYMLTDDGDDVTKHLFNINISASQNGTKLVCTWYYVLLGSENKTQDDNTPPSTFNGSWSDGTITATGPGKITLKDFYYDGSKEYAVGEFMWPDGTTAAIALVRP